MYFYKNMRQLSLHVCIGYVSACLSKICLRVKIEP